MHRHPSGREYKLSEVSAATEDQLTTSWLSLLRKGAIVRPGADKIQLLADFFGVDASYFTGKQAPRQDEMGTAEDEELRRAIAQPLIRQMALRAGRLDEADQARLYELVNQALALGARVREERERGTRSPLTDTSGTADDSPASMKEAMDDRPREET